MRFKKGDRVLYNRQKFGTVISDQFDPSKVDVVFDREKNKVVLVTYDTLELIADAEHEAVLTAQINEAIYTDINAEHVEPGLAAELVKLADRLETDANTETNMLRLRMTMRDVSYRLRGIAKDL
jgi:hypothetical protein